MDPKEIKMSESRCHICGNTEFEKQRVEYIYRRSGNYLIVRDVPCEVCLHCGERFYEGVSLLKVEQRFQAIYEHHARPRFTQQVPIEEFA